MRVRPTGSGDDPQQGSIVLDIISDDPTPAHGDIVQARLQLQPTFHVAPDEQARSRQPDRNAFVLRWISGLVHAGKPRQATAPMPVPTSPDGYEKLVE